jgi:hypothetical protein
MLILIIYRQTDQQKTDIRTNKRTKSRQIGKQTNIKPTERQKTEK